jgi:nicotinamidase/pyrazinamidase
MRALVLVDIQRDFIDGALPVPKAAEIVPVCNKLQERYTLVAATQDWHPDGDPEFEQFPVHCLAGSEGAKLHPELETVKIAKVFQKQRFSGFSNPELESWLRARGVTEVHVAGLATDFCVRATALDAAKLGFRTRVVLDGSRGVATDDTEVIGELLDAGVELEVGGAVLDLGPPCCRGIW